MLGHPKAGEVAIRGRVWLPPAYPCTAGIPEACFADPVLARARPTDTTSRVIHLHGYLAPYRPLTCTGRHGALSCPLPFDGREYGVTGNLRVEPRDYEGVMLELDVTRLCRFP
ncbi:MAG: hypothetical protein QM765_12430 [Myxococcales bacterium]